GPDWVDLGPRRPDGEVTLRLVKDDVPITGRVLDLEGRPVAGAFVGVAWVEQVNLKPWLDDPTKRDLRTTKGAGAIILDGPTSTKTDKDGRFRLTGFGRDRVASLMVRGEGIEYADFKAIARAGAAGLRSGPEDVYAPGADHTVRPCKPIVGTVRD